MELHADSRSVSRIGDVGISPEGAGYTSPGQRPGLGINTSSEALKGRDIKSYYGKACELLRQYVALTTMKETSEIEHNYVTPLQGLCCWGVLQTQGAALGWYVTPLRG